MTPYKPHLLKFEEWQDGCGNWCCNDVSDLGHDSGAWWHPCRLLKITPAEFVKLLVEVYHCSDIHFTTSRNVLMYSWKDQSQMRKFKNWLNAQARKTQYFV
jgi:hypothetical protein